MDVVGKFGKLLCQQLVRGAEFLQLPVPAFAVFLRQVTRVPRHIDGHVHEVQCRVHCGPDGGGPPGLDAPAACPFGCLLAGTPFSRRQHVPARQRGCVWPPPAPRCSAVTSRASTSAARAAEAAFARASRSAVDGSCSSGTSWAAASRAVMAASACSSDSTLASARASEAASRSLSPTALRSTELRCPSRSATAASRASDSCNLLQGGIRLFLRSGALRLGPGQGEPVALQGRGYLPEAPCRRRPRRPGLPGVTAPSPNLR